MSKAGKNTTGRYYAIRIFIFPLLLYFLLVLPIQGIMTLKNVPDFVKKYRLADTVSRPVSNINADTLNAHCNDSVNPACIVKHVDSIAHKVVKDGIHKHNGIYLNYSSDTVSLGASLDIGGNDGAFNKSDDYDRQIGWIMFFCFLVGVSFNFPFRIYFRRLRKGKTNSDKLRRYVRKYLQYTPHINSGIYALGFLILHITSIYILNHGLCDPLEHRLFKNLLIISIGSSVLTVLFVYQWQKHRVQFKYLEHIYSKEELERNIYKTKRSHTIKTRLWLITLFTTILPLTIVIYYFVSGISTVEDSGIKTLTPEHLKLLLGKFYDLIVTDTQICTIENGIKFPYVTSVDVVFTMSGITVSTITAIIYIIFLVNWTAKSINIPVQNLLENMKKAGENNLSAMSLVRTNDEMGNLSEGFNQMAGKIKMYIEEISEMNRNLEQKVADRTAEVVQQKEEIETQRDLILEKNEELIQQQEEIISQKDEIELQKKILEEKNKNITDSIRYARRIQKAMLPSPEELFQIIGEHFIFYRPKDIVSGDFYWVREIDENNYLFIVADCTGHGVPGAFMSIVGNNILNRAVIEQKLYKPNEVLNFLSSELKYMLRRDYEDSNVSDGMDITICLINRKSYEIELAGVHNPLYLIRSKELLIFKTDSFSVGDNFTVDFSGYNNIKIQAQAGDIIYLFSDGFVDQFGGKEKRKYLSKNFRNTLVEISNLSLKEQQEMLLRIFEYWRGELEQTDDVLIAGIKL